MKRIQKEHKILRSPNSLPSGVYVRTWETRLDLLRVLFVGPADTPYVNAPFVIDFYLSPQFPTQPPEAYFHSWTSDSGLGGVGRVNPNLYEDGKICLSLLGTWEGNKGEGWNASRSTLLQVIVSILGLVLVREPYFNEAGYEPLVGLESSKRPSALYSERAYLRSRTFVMKAVGWAKSIDSAVGTALEGLQDVVWRLYRENGLLEQVVRDVDEVLERSEGGMLEPDGLTVISKGACIPLKRVREELLAL
jgi:ubiquitin-conjugating enzyme E2 O